MDGAIPYLTGVLHGLLLKSKFVDITDVLPNIPDAFIVCFQSGRKIEVKLKELEPPISSSSE
jgi:hypothetical protein